MYSVIKWSSKNISSFRSLSSFNVTSQLLFFHVYFHIRFVAHKGHEEYQDDELAAVQAS